MVALAKHFRNPQIIAISLIWVISFLLYFFSMPPGNSGVADADEFLSIAYSGGVAHAPGYSLYTTLLELVIKSPLPGSIPAKAGMLSNFFQATAGIFVFLIAQILFQKIAPKKNKSLKSSNRIIALLAIGALLTQSNLLIWQYAHVSEVFALTNFFIAVSVFAWLSATTARTKWHLYGAFIIWGLGVSHHYLLLGLLPIVLATTWLFWKSLTKRNERIRLLLLAISSFSLGFGVFQVLLVWRLMRQAPVSWIFPLSFNGWWEYISRGLYSGMLSDGTVSKGLFAPIVFSDALQSLLNYVSTLAPNYIGVGALFLGSIAIILLLRKRQSLWIYSLLITTLVMTLGIVVILTIPSGLDMAQSWETKALTERMLLPGFMLFGMFVPLGIVLTSKWLEEKLHWFSHLIFIPICLVLWGTVIILNAREFTYLKSGYPAPNQIKQQLIELPQNAVIACFSDLSCFTSMYYLSVEKLRPDVQLVPVSEQLRFETGSQQVIVRYPDNPLRISYVAGEALAQGKPFFVSQIAPLYQDIWNINSTFALDAKPVFKQVTCGIKESKPKLVPTVIYPDPAPSPSKLSSVLYQRSFIASEIDEHHGALDCPQASALAQQAIECSALSCQLRLGLLATMLEPYNSNYRSMLAGFYEGQQLVPLAIREYQVAYTLDAGNATAAAALSRLNQANAYPVNLEGL